MNIDIAQAKCTEVCLSSPIRFSPDTPEVEFEIDAYTGAIVDRWWGKLALDLKGMSAKQKLPILRDHDTSQIVGYSKKSGVDGAFKVSGQYSKTTKTAQEVRALADEGFPWQASVRAVPLSVLSLSENQTHEVNGITLKGPAEVWTKTRIEEVSFVPLGADSDTSVASFSKFTEAPPVAPQPQPKKETKPMTITIETLNSDAPELLAQIQENARVAGAKAERERIQAVLAQKLAGHDALVEALAFDGTTTGEQAAVQVLAAERTLRKTKGEEFNTDGIAPVPATPPFAPQPKTKQPPANAEQFAADEDLVEEFGDYETYAAFQAATKKGLVRILKNKEK